MKKICTLLVILTLAACNSDRDSSRHESMSMSRKMVSPAVNDEAARGDNLAYSHRYSIHISDDNNFNESYSLLSAFCKDKAKTECYLMNSSISDDYRKSASISFKVSPRFVTEIVELASSHGKVTSQSTWVEDLTKRVTDVKKRKQMLQRYEQELLTLKTSSAGDVDTLIKIAEELVATQSKLETIAKEQAELDSRINLDNLDVNLSSDAKKKNSTPIADAIDEFIDHLAEGVATFITGIAFLLPWLLSIIAIVWAILRLRRRLKA